MFGGGVYMIVVKKKSIVEVFNDMDNEFINFFLVLCLEKLEFIYVLELLLISRMLFEFWLYVELFVDLFEKVVCWYYLFC